MHTAMWHDTTYWMFLYESIVAVAKVSLGTICSRDQPSDCHVSCH